MFRNGHKIGPGQRTHMPKCMVPYTQVKAPSRKTKNTYVNVYVPDWTETLHRNKELRKIRETHH